MLLRDAFIQMLESRVLLSVPRPAFNTGTGFFVSNGLIYDANGNEFVMKGPNAIHAWGSYNTNYNAIDQIAKTGANAVRVVTYQDITSDSSNPWTDSADTPARRQTVAERYIANGMAVIIEDHASIADGGSVQSNKTALDEITAHWLTNQSWLKTYEKYVIVNIANEWGQLTHANNSDHTWRDAYIDEVTKIRKGPNGVLGDSDDITNMLMIDSGQWGQDYNDLKFDAAAILNADPQHNTVFSIHLYGSWRDDSRTFEQTPNNDYGPWDVNTALSQLRAANLPLVVGEFAWEDFKDFSSSSAPYGAYRTQRLLQILDPLHIGWLGWSYNGSSPQTLNMLTNLNNINYNTNTDLSEWGNALVNDPTYGLKASAQRATVFNDPLPSMSNPAFPLPAPPASIPSDLRFVLEKTTIGVAEGGQGSVQVKLNRQPASSVTLNLSKTSGDIDVNLVTTNFTFTTSNWNQYQTIVVSANSDGDTTVGSAKFQLAGSGLIATDFTAKEIEPPAAPSGNVFTINPDRDRLYSGSGTSTALTVDSVFPTTNGNPTPNGTMYLRFPLSTLRGKISSATLRVYTTNTIAGRRVRVYAALGDAWTEISTPSNANPIYATYPLIPGADNTGWLLPTSGGSYLDISFAELANFVAAESLKDAVVTLALRMVSSTASFQTREGANPPQLVINTVEAVPPQVTVTSYAYIAAPHELNITFSENVQASLSEADLILDNLTTDTTVPAGSMDVSYNAGTNVATFTFPGFSGGVLPNGSYSARLLASGVSDAASNKLSADSLASFYFQMGDANHDGSVDTIDFNTLAANFGLEGQTFGDGDFDYSGSIDTVDFNLLAGEFGAALFGSTQLASRAPVPAAGAPVQGSLAPHNAPKASIVEDVLI